ncbi:JAB domain-containing protein [Lactobacillus xylocopicola]|uniref:DNA repair protein RadC n=1 Tax=Lactobacillus xylocopicola TaxID=2976676 RepID=A0ABN6SJ57_9LACO|nr:JAB domain-containing protein [Lactobacillus xylocopicola]BDR60386.1 DNA repair protein RadC [Lactobacillus xylocopicola]
MKISKADRYLVKTDVELLGALFNQLNERNITSFDQLTQQLRQLKINNFNDLLKYLSGETCNEDLALLCENLLDRLRGALPDRESVLTSSSEVGTYLINKLAGHKQEELWAIYIDNSSHIIAEKQLFQGTLDKSVAHPREVFRWAVLYACAGLLVVHNHPSGNLLPSKSDIAFTESLQTAAKLLHIDFLDHFIVGKGHYLSMREQQLC